MSSLKTVWAQEVIPGFEKITLRNSRYSYNISLILLNHRIGTVERNASLDKVIIQGIVEGSTNYL